MAKRKVSNLLALAVLSLLTERPMHPYDVSSTMRQRELSSAIKLNYGSLYSVIEALQREGLIVSTGTQREGRYPERTVYTITEAGRAEFVDWLRVLLSRPTPEYTQFAAALTFIAHLPPIEAATLLEEHVQHLQEEIGGTQTTLEKGHQMGVSEIFLVEDTYTLAQHTFRLSFVQQLVQKINNGTLTETREGQRIWKMTPQDYARWESTLEKAPENPDSSS